MCLYQNKESLPLLTAIEKRKVKNEIISYQAPQLSFQEFFGQELHALLANATT